MPSWWDRLRGRGNSKSPVPASGGGEGQRARWLAPADPGNPFGVELLDLMMTQQLIATTGDPKCAERSVSWHESIGDELDASDAFKAPPIDCALELPAAQSLPEGIVYAPASMDEKWVIAWRGGHLLAARSWTGAVEAVARAKHDGERLAIDRLWVIESSMLHTGPLPDTFEWLVRAHALGQRIPYPLNDDGAATFEATPTMAFSGFGKVIFCATKAWAPPPIRQPLRSDGALIRAVRRADHAEIRRVVERGADLDAPATFAGYTALHIAIVRKDTETFLLLRELGASTTDFVDRGMHALGIAIVHKAPMEILESLADGDLDLTLPNEDGFNALHAAAETNRGDIVPWLVAHGLPLEARTQHGHTALHIGCALGHLDATRALLDAGADPKAESPAGTPLDVARSEGKSETVALLKARSR